MANLTPEQISALQQKGALTPETAQALSAKVSSTSPAPDIVAEAAQVGQTFNAAADLDKADALDNDANAMEQSLKERMAFDASKGIPEAGLREKYAVDLANVQKLRENALGLRSSVQQSTPQLSQEPAREPSQEPTVDPNEFVMPQQAGGQDPNPMDEALKRQQGLVGGIQSGYDRQMEGVKDAASAGAKKAIEEAAYLKTANDELEKLEAQRLAKEEERQKALDAEMNNLKSTIDEVQNAKVDPNRFWNSKSTGQKVMAGLGMILAGIGGGMTGRGGNAALDVINNAIQNDIDAQKTEIEKLKSIGSMKQNLYGMMRDRFGDERQAEAAAKAAYFQRVEMQLKEMATRYQAPEIQAKAEQALGQLQVMKNAAILQFEQAAGKKTAIKLAGGEQLPDGVDIESLTEDQRKRYVPGFGLATTYEGAKELRTLGATVSDINNSLDQLIQFTNKPISKISPTDKSNAETLSAMLVGALRLPITGPGALSDGERELLQKIVANPTDIFKLPSTARASLNKIKEKMNFRLNSTAKANGIKTPGSQVTTFKPAQ